MKKKSFMLFFTTSLILSLGILPIQGHAGVSSEFNSEQQIEYINPQYLEIDNMKATFNISGTTANLLVSVISSPSKQTSIKMVLQRKDGDSWTKVQKWTKEGKGGQTLSKSITVTKGKKYRMKYTVTVDSETITKKTAAKTA